MELAEDCWDSTWESEYQEVHQKAAVLYRKQARFQLITTGNQPEEPAV